MRSRSNSGVRLDGYVRLVQETILRFQVSTDTHCTVQERSKTGTLYTVKGILFSNKAMRIIRRTMPMEMRFLNAS